MQIKSFKVSYLSSLFSLQLPLHRQHFQFLNFPWLAHIHVFTFTILWLCITIWKHVRPCKCHTLFFYQVNVKTHMAHFDFSLYSDFTLPINWQFIKHAHVCLHFDVETKNINSVFLYCEIVYEQILDSYWHFSVCLNWLTSFHEDFSWNHWILPAKFHRAAVNVTTT